MSFVDMAIGLEGVIEKSPLMSEFGPSDSFIKGSLPTLTNSAYSYETWAGKFKQALD